MVRINITMVRSIDLQQVVCLDIAMSDRIRIPLLTQLQPIKIEKMTSCRIRKMFSARLNGLLISFGLALMFQTATVHADELQNRFDTAMAALEADRVYEARRLLTELVNDYPSLNRARVELARADYYVRDYDAAEAEVLTVLEDPDTPTNVKPTLLAFLAQIRDDRQTFEQKNQWGGFVYSGVMYDSNVNYGANDVILGGIPFSLEGEESDWAGVLEGGISHTYNPNKSFKSGDKTGYFFWQSSANGYYRGYTDENDFNLGVATLRTGPVWAVADAWRASVAVQGDQIWFGSDRLAFFTSLNPTYSVMLAPRTELTIDGVLQDRNYNDSEDEGRNGTLWGSTVVLSQFYLERRLGVQGGVGYSDFNADENAFSYKLPEVFGGATYDAWRRGTIYTRVGYRWYDYDKNFDGLAAIIGSNDRDDDELRIIGGFRHEIGGEFMTGWVIRGEYVWTDNDSDVDVFDYDRSQISLGISKGFN